MRSGGEEAQDDRGNGIVADARGYEVGLRDMPRNAMRTKTTIGACYFLFLLMCLVINIWQKRQKTERIPTGVPENMSGSLIRCCFGDTCHGAATKKLENFKYSNIYF